MKLNTDNVDLATTHGVAEQTDFSINVSAQAFSILSSGMYKNPIKAIIRELSTNAVDSHIDAGTTDKPFDVELPTRFAPLFRIRDYGTGLSKKDVLGLYSTYFSSTKTDSNEQIGALGLGSKSPLGYTNSFSVVSWFKGTKTNFSVFIGDNGFPNIAVTAENKSKEPSGLEIIIPVKEEGYYMDRWYENAREVYQYFDKFPNMVNEDDSNEVHLRKPKYERTIGKIRIHENKSHVSNIVQGMIAYPLDYDQLEIDDKLLKIISDISFDVYVDIGEVSFLPNREELSYDDKTKKNIKEAIEVFVDDLEVDVIKSIEEIRTYNSALHTFRVLNDNYSDLFEYKPEIKTLLQDKLLRWKHFMKFEWKTGRRYYYSGSSVQVKVGYINKVLENRFGKSVYYLEGKRPKFRDDYQGGDRKLVFWVNDLKKAIITKFPLAVKDKNHNFLIPEFETKEKAVAYIKRKFGVTNKEIKFTSELNIPELIKVKHKGVMLNRFRLVSYTHGYNPTKSWRWERGVKLDSAENAMKYNQEKKIVWVEQKASQAVNFKSKEGMEFARFLGGDNRSTWELDYVHGVKTKDIEKVKDRPDWIHIDDWVKQFIEKELVKSHNPDLAYTIDELSTIRSFARSHNLPTGINNPDILAIVDLLKNVNTTYQHESIDNKIRGWCLKIGIENLTEINIDFDGEIVYNDGLDLHKFIQEKYPHLELIAGVLSYGNHEAVKNLINDLY